MSRCTAALILLGAVGSVSAADPTCTAGSEACAATPTVTGSALMQRDVQRGRLHDTSRLAQAPTCRSGCAREVRRGEATWAEQCLTSRCAACVECIPTPAPTPAPTPEPTPAPIPTGPRWPSEVMTCPSTAVGTTQAMTCADYDAVVTSVRTTYNTLPTTCTPQHCPQADWAGCVLRIAGHDLMDFKDGVGGADGCLDFYDHDNAGLAECLYTGDHGVSVLAAYQQHCATVSLADFLVIAAEAVMTISREHVTNEDATRPPVDFKRHFRFGRTTAAECSWSMGRLPNPERSCTAVNETFIHSMGLDWAGAAALMGVHTLGRASIQNSGYDGFWSDAENSRRFNNNYYASILGKGWMTQTAVAGNPNKNQWIRVDDGADVVTKGKEMMLDTDLCLAFTKDDFGLEELKAVDADCCAWVSPRFLENPRTGTGAIPDHLNGEFCGNTTIPGASDFRLQRAICCDGDDSPRIDCGLPNAPTGPAFTPVRDFANNEGAWLSAFQAAWTLSTENGFGSLHALQSCP